MDDHDPRQEPAARTVRRSYVDGRWGQVHLWRSTPAVRDAPPLVCLHATAYSGQTFLPLMQALAPRRTVIAIDTPGYGASDPPPARPSVAAYAEAIAEAVVAATAGPVDLLGYHTGAMLAVEMAAAQPSRVRRLVLMGVPFFEGAERAAWRSKLVHQRAFSEDFEPVRERWRYFIEGRTPGLALDRAFACFVDDLRAWPHDSWAHEALFDHDAAAQLAGLMQPVCVLNPATALAQASRDAAARMPHAHVVELPQLGGAPFDLGSALLAAKIERFLGP